MEVRYSVHPVEWELPSLVASSGVGPVDLNILALRIHVKVFCSISTEHDEPLLLPFREF